MTPDEFMRRVEFDTNGGCWLWAAGRTRDGYGTAQHGKRTLLAHRVSWALFAGSEPGRLLVCHRCDTPACVNPAHLFLGDQASNMADMVAKGRASRKFGQRNGRAVLSDVQTREIHDLTRLGLFSGPEIARSYRVSNTTVSRIKRMKDAPNAI